MKFVKLEYERYTEHNNDAEDSDEPYSYRGTTSTSWHITHLTLHDKDKYDCMRVQDEVTLGDKLFVVYAVYSSGDSFGHDRGSNMEFISVHKTAELAFANQAAIEDRTGQRADGNFTITLDNGEKLSRYCPWDGYFESLDKVDVVELMVKSR